MDTETIQQLITMFSELGGDAKEAFIWYLVITYVPGWILGLFWTIGGIWLLSHLVGLLSRAVANGMQSDQLRRSAGVSIYWSEEELEKACRVLHEHWND